MISGDSFHIPAYDSIRPGISDGTQRIPAATEKLKKIPNRKPWQASVHVSFDQKGLADVPELKNDEGLFVQTLNFAAGDSCVPRPDGR